MFSKAKRFEDKVSCAPPPGTYTLPDGKSAILTSFDKSKRFIEPKATPMLNSTHTELSILSNNNQFEQSILSLTHTLINQSASTCKKKTPALKRNPMPAIAALNLDGDMCRKSLEADMEFQESKMNFLLQKISALEAQITDMKRHSSDLEESNNKLHELTENVRKEKSTIQIENESLENKIKAINEEREKEKESFESNNLKHKMELADIDNVRLKEREDLEKRLEISQNLNCDFREQLESIELSMTGNLKDLTTKYETLEDTLKYVKKDYAIKLEAANTMLDNSKEKYSLCQQELEGAQGMCNSLREQITSVTSENDDHSMTIKNQQQLQDQLKAEKEVIEGELKSMMNLKEENTLEYERQITLLNEKIVNEKSEHCSQVEQLNDDLNGYKSLLHEKEELQEKTAESHSIELSTLRAHCEEQQRSMHLLSEENEQLKINIKEQKKTAHIELERLKSEEKKLMQEIITIKDANQKKLREQENVINESKSMHAEVVKRLMETQIKLTKAEQSSKNVVNEEERNRLLEEIKTWKTKFESLNAKVSPFISQLEKFQEEKDFLLNENATSQQELNNLADKYATLLGHQNNKQKIHHVRKLKEENFSLKMEVNKLRAAVSKHKRSEKENGKNFDVKTKTNKKPLGDVNT